MSRPFFIWIYGGSWLHFDIHRDPNCHRLSITVGRIGFRWPW